MFVDPAYGASDEYREFWATLASGQAIEDEFERIGKGGKRITIRASYNPVKNAAGEVFKVVKFAVDTTLYRTVVETMIEGLSALASGNLNCELTTDLGEFDQLRVDFNLASGKLREIVTSLSENADMVNAEAAGIAQATDNLARRTEQQAATLEESAAALEELVASVNGVADTATDVQKKSDDAQSHTTEASSVVTRAVSAMDEIETSSKQVASITSVIDDIAFQTNLLALNAGVEAARAGEAGRGFAVVASEVRALAQRSSEAAREIASLITTSGRQVATGVDLVGEVGEALGSIKEVVEEIHRGISAVASSTNEQATGLGELNAAVTQLDQTTQHNAAMAEETNAATVNLQQTIGDMDKTLRFFGTGSSTASAQIETIAPQNQLSA